LDKFVKVLFTQDCTECPGEKYLRRLGGEGLVIMGTHAIRLSFRIFFATKQTKKDLKGQKDEIFSVTACVLYGCLLIEILIEILVGIFQLRGYFFPDTLY